MIPAKKHLAVQKRFGYARIRNPESKNRMWLHYWLRPTVDREPDPVILALHERIATDRQFEIYAYIIGARTLGSTSGFTPQGIQQVMDAGANFNRSEGVRLSTGMNVVDPEPWRRQGIGTAIMNRMIRWAQHQHPDASVRPVELHYYDRPIVRTDPRLAFYERFGLRWSAADYLRNPKSWDSLPMAVSKLTPAALSPRLRYLLPPAQKMQG